MELYLVRHTTPDISRGVCYGQSDIDVAASFAAELEMLKDKLGAKLAAPVADIGTIYSSPMQRCTKLADELANSLNLRASRKDPRLMELDFGDWELRRWDDIPRDEFDRWAYDHVHQAPPNGESFYALHKRAAAFLAEVKARPAKACTVVVTHGGVIRALLAEVLGLPLIEVFRFQIDCASVTQLVLDEKVMRVGYVNR